MPSTNASPGAAPRSGRGSARERLRRGAVAARRAARDVARRAVTARRRRIAEAVAGSGSFARHARLLPPGRHRRVVLLGDDELTPGLLGRCLDGLAHDNAHLLLLPGLALEPRDSRLKSVVRTSNPDDLVEWCVANGPVDMIVDLCAAPPGARRERWVQLFLHLRTSGAWVLVRRGATGDLRVRERTWLVELATDVAANPKVTDLDVAKECLRSVAGLTARADIVVIEKGLHHLVKLRIAESTTTLLRRAPHLEVDVLDALPALEFTSPARTYSHTSTAPMPGFPERFSVPELTVRHYHGRLAFTGRGLLHTNGIVLGDSFRFFLRDKPVNPNLWDFTPRIARMHPGWKVENDLEGSYFLLDPAYTSHFGHIMTELVARLWAWDDAKRQVPELKALIRRKPDVSPTVERTLMHAWGIDDADIEIVSEPKFISSLVSATPMWHNWEPYFVHPELRATWRRLGEQMVAGVEPSHARRIFVSRSQTYDVRRACTNAADVEQFFAARGFTVVYPEHLTLAEQAAVFAGAEIVAGFGGSALFNLMYAGRARTVIVLCHESYTARNEHMYCALLGCDAHYFWSTAEHSHPEGQWAYRAFQSPWQFDFERNAADLDDVISAL